MEINSSDIDRIYDDVLKYDTNNGINLHRSLLDQMFDDGGNTFNHIPILADEAFLKMNQIFDHLHSGAPIMFISACTGLDSSINHSLEEYEENEKNNLIKSKSLNVDLDKLGMPYIKINGHWIKYFNSKKRFDDEKEYSFMVIGVAGNTDSFISEDYFLKKGIELCGKYNQYAVMIGKNLIPDNPNKDDFKFVYYRADGAIDSTFHKYRIESNEDIKELVTRYTTEINEYRYNHFMTTQEEQDKFNTMINRYHGATGFKDIDGIETNIVFESFTVKNNLPYKMGMACNINTI